jgi:hypothetical protein
MKRIVILLVLVSISSGCSNFAASGYAISVDNLVELRDLDGKTINVGPFTSSEPGEPAFQCREVEKIKTPDGEPFSDFMRKFS